MSSHLRPTKQQKIEPPRPPRATTKLPAWNTSNSRTRGVARADSGSVPPSAGAMSTSSAHRTSSQTVRKPAVPLDTFGSRVNHVPTPHFQAATTPQVDLQVDKSDSNDSGNEADKTGSEEDHDSSSASDGEGYESSDEEDEEDEDMGFEEVRTDIADLNEESKFQTEQELEVYIKSLRVKHVKQANRKSARSKNKPVTHAPVPAVSSSKFTTPAPTAKTVGNTISEVKGGMILDERHKNLNHALKCLMSLCGVKKAQDAARMVPRFTNTGEPDYFDKQGCLTPYFDRPFNENFQAWGKEFLELATDPFRMSAMPEANQTYLMAVSCEQYRDVLSAAGFATMRDAWKKNRDGKGDEKKANRNRAARRWARKTAKANRRQMALEGSGLDIAAFGFLADPGFQSSEYSDTDDESLCVVQVPTYRTEKVNQLLDALDIAFKAGKKRAGNPQFSKYHYPNVDIKAQSRKSKSGASQDGQQK